jgi:protocatechuate 3,4-dioxygenase beta subunit
MKEQKIIDRRTFMKASSLFALAVSVPVIACKGDKDDADDPEPSECRTTEDILGPYYKAGAPFRETIIPDGNTAPPLIIEGKVFSNCDDPINEASVEIWNADADGGYDLSDNFIFRGSFKTGSDGRYKFMTIIPGQYLNGGTYRPSHLHFRITASGHEELVSQVYFANDPFITTDPWASAPQAVERILTVGKAEDNTDTVTFDIHLNPLQ